MQHPGVSAGDPKILDFGIALLLDGSSRLTRTGMDQLTLPYASPEQIRMESEVTTLTDVYSLGVVFYEAVSGHHPFGGSGYDIAARILRDDPLLIPNVPRDLNAILQKALSKMPADRYESVAQFRDDIERFRLGRPVAARFPAACT